MRDLFPQYRLYTHFFAIQFHSNSIFIAILLLAVVRKLKIFPFISEKRRNIVQLNSNKAFIIIFDYFFLIIYSCVNLI